MVGGENFGIRHKASKGATSGRGLGICAQRFIISKCTISMGSGIQPYEVRVDNKYECGVVKPCTLPPVNVSSFPSNHVKGKVLQFLSIACPAVLLNQQHNEVIQSESWILRKPWNQLWASSDNLVPMTHGFIYNLGIKFFELKLDFISTSVQCYNNSSPVFFRAAGGSQTESELSRELASGRIIASIISPTTVM